MEEEIENVDDSVLVTDDYFVVTEEILILL